MTTKMLLMFAATGLITPVALEGSAEAGRTTIATILNAPEKDLAPVSNGRLRRTNEEQAGREMSTFVCLGDGKQCLTAMSTSSPPVVSLPRERPRPVELTKFPLGQATDGSVTATADAPGRSS
jgi:hypothetical protein